MKDLYQFKISIARTNPLIWRRVLVPSSYSLMQLHHVIQTCFGWCGWHLFAFSIYDEIYDDEMPGRLSKKISTLGLAPKRKFKYIYDFGDNWEHHIVLEKIHPNQAGLKTPYCIEGERAAPPDDCGGVWGYEDALKILADKTHPEYEELSEWYGDDFNPEAFDLNLINQQFNPIPRRSKKVKT